VLEIVLACGVPSEAAGHAWMNREGVLVLEIKEKQAK
jgi:hypothetical protein